MVALTPGCHSATSFAKPWILHGRPDLMEVLHSSPASPRPLIPPSTASGLFGEEHLLPQWQAEDQARCQATDGMTHYHQLQIQDFLQAIVKDRTPAITGREGRKHVEVFTATYRSQRDR